MRAFLLHELRPLRRVIAASLVLTVLGQGVEVWLIGYAGRLVDLLAASSPERLWDEHGAGLVTAGLLILLVRPLLGLLNEGVDDIAYRPNARARLLWRLHRHVSRQSVGWFRRRLAGTVATDVREGAAAATDAVYSVMHTVAAVTAYIVGSVILLGVTDPRLILPLLGWIGLYAGLMVYVIPRYRDASDRLQRENAALTGLLVDSYANSDTLALFADRAGEDEQARRVLAAARRAQCDVQRVEVTINSGMLFLSGVLLVSLAGWGIVLWQAGEAPIGLVAAALALSFRITGMAEWLIDGVSGLFGALGTLRRSLRTVAQPWLVADAPGARALSVRGGGIRFAGVSHHYGRAGGGGLDGVSLTVAPGERVGLVGRSGAGKSTLVGLLLRFHDAEAGTITIDGQDVARVTQESLRRQIAVVTQETMLLARSVRDNIAGAALNGSVRTAARRAAADGFIAGLRDADGNSGYDAQVGERGVTLSGGQRQRVALARAFHKDAPILVLDEATSALDSEVEAAVHETLDEVLTGRTVIAIAHRLSTIARMDRIVVLDAGRVAEEGTHAELLARGGLYAGLWARQSGGFL